MLSSTCYIDMCRPRVLGALPSQYRTLRIISRCGLDVFYAPREAVLVSCSLWCVKTCYQIISDLGECLLSNIVVAIVTFLPSTDAPIHKDDKDEETNPTYAKFMGADANHDGRLDLDEFVPFIHPFRHDHMIVHLINDQLTMYDYNKDGSISLDEFLSE